MSFLETAVSLILLVVAADRIVEGSLGLSSKLGLSKVVVGVVILGFSGGLPELTAAGLASFHRLGGVALGSVIGSITINTTLVLGVAALIRPIAIRSSLMKREGIIAAAATVIFFAMALEGISHLEAAIALALFVAVTIYLVMATSPADIEELVEETTEAETVQAARRKRLNLGPVGDLAVGLVLMIAAAEVLVLGINGLIHEFHIDQGIAGALLVATGASIPELLNAIAAARRNEPEIVVGNVLGAVLFNATAVAGFAGIFHGALLSSGMRSFALPLMVVDVAACLTFLLTGGRLRRLEAAALLGLYVTSVIATAL